MRANREYRRLTARCRHAAGALPLPRPFELQRFIQLLAADRGRPITVLPIPARPNGPCGLLAATDEVDYILYAADTSPMHQQHILLHEIAHLLCEHHRRPAAEDAPGDAPFAALLPRLPQELVSRVLGRSGYSEPQEREAELLATLIQCRVDQDAALPSVRDTRHPALRSLLGVGVGVGVGVGERGSRRRE
ncbi:ParH-like protein [Streptacidiphilus sp. P02-A3a]|uniref:ParH-like protein n=1 Tax=Streptacidiphilus sp. P02-A3a TaxID=2704468 RepID=UPI0015FBAFD3|nr:ParH-like protein [Streptacidiphilus sp. P02-A3a]QMU71490.1 ParH-like protein [Streptacidiphilus sp. P02-A3a]